jgi:hypothetical protein
MEENTGNSRAASHGSNTLTESNTAVARGAGIVAGATFSADFENGGLNNALRLASGGTLDFSSAWSVMMWVNADTFAALGALMGKGDTEFRALVDSTAGTPGQVLFQIDNNAQTYASPQLSTATEYMLLFVYDPAANFGISINGDALTAGNTDDVGTGNEIPAGSNDFWFGTETSGGFCYNGKMGPTAFWSRVLTDEEIDWLYNGGDGRVYGDL